MDKATLDRQIKEATQAHGAWKQKLCEAVKSGTLPKPARDIACDDQCSFGKWLHMLKADSTVAVSMHFRRVMVMHADFHKEAGRIAGLIEDGASAQALAALNGSNLQDRSGKLEAAMADWARNL
ncbi:CZB domain-containing protein [Mesobacterium sp. TK19101]|uniref:CZB domain-containing protein n=1 Tax=Mesobacterium hydrothermale TaxID=3111907 RepID=A0ABU6HKG3_9RHOB|nr:CZB domain-containing protein [Mesobacterium sp. TK19101]MEC3861650.1 CZB domain-containing protein [Mesobacterium sp. TK19101]